MSSRYLSCQKCHTRTNTLIGSVIGIKYLDINSLKLGIQVGTSFKEYLSDHSNQRLRKNKDLLI